jgi:hypothetical protein
MYMCSKIGSWMSYAQWRNSYTFMLLLFIIISEGGTKSTGYCGHFWPIVQTPDDGWGWLWSNWWNEDWQGKPKYSEKTCPSATVSTTNPTWPNPGSNPGRRGGKPATNRLSYGAAYFYVHLGIILILVLGLHSGPPDRAWTVHTLSLWTVSPPSSRLTVCAPVWSSNIPKYLVFRFFISWYWNEL